MTQNRKTLGMTSTQIGILIGLVVVVCILFAVVLWMMFGGNIRMPSFSRAAQNTPIPQMTSTPVVFATLTPTPTQTPIPYEQLIPNGWKQFKTELVEIWLPPSFKSVKKSEGEELTLQGETSKNSLYNMMATVYYAPLTGNSLDEHLDADVLKMDPLTRLTERKKISLNGVGAVRITLETRVDGMDLNQLTYAIQDGGTVWFVSYIAQINEFYEMLPVFEQSAKTFRIAK